jgi:sirohydrochlorin cobaltochelatase
VDLDAKLKTILPEQYRECYEDVQPVSMGSAGLKFDAAGRVAWDEIWGSFCDLAMAGGPPHRGTLLEPPAAADQAVVDEICRGIRMVTELAVDRAAEPGWVELYCTDPGMAGWLVRAIVMENVSAVAEGSVVRLPAGAGFRLEKEIKNVVTTVAKTAHYYVHHIGPGQKRAIAELFSAPLLQPGRNVASPSLLAAVVAETGLTTAPKTYPGWLGLQCESVRETIWMMRALVADDMVARREETVLFVPVNPDSDPDGLRLVAAVSYVRELYLRNCGSEANARGVSPPARLG